MNQAKSHIQFGVICNDINLPFWQDEVIGYLLEDNNIDLKLVLIESDLNAKKPVQNNYQQHEGFLSKVLYKRLLKKSESLQKLNANILSKIPVQQYCTFHHDHSGQLNLDDNAISVLADAELDFVLNFSTYPLNGEINKVTKYGIWYFQFGQHVDLSGRLIGFWEIYENNPVVKARLLKSSLTSDEALLLKEGVLKTKISLAKNTATVLNTCAKWPLQLCHDIRYNTGVTDGELFDNSSSEKLPLPTNYQWLKFLIIQLRLFCRKAYKSIFITDYWNIGVADIPIEKFLNQEMIPQVTWFSKLPGTRFMADPFGLYHNEKLHIVYEDFRFDQGVGKIASVPYADGAFGNAQIVIDEATHMSYPFLVEKGGEIYSIPETYQKNQVWLYKAIAFPTKWKPIKLLLDNYAGIDSTVYEYKGTWYLFSTEKNSGAHYNLNIHYADKLFGPWVAHPKNPVKTDIRSARPAGSIFSHDGHLYRPSMDYSEKVEGRIVINKIKTLTIIDFKEEVHRIINPFKDTYFSDKVHTLGQVGPYTMVDGAKELFVLSNFSAFRFKIKSLFRKLKLFSK